MAFVMDGGGGRVLIDPDSLRHAAARVKAVGDELSVLAGALSRVGYPAMPPGVLAIVSDAVGAAQSVAQRQLGPLSDTAVELTRRAFWAECADRLMGGYVLSGPAKQEFLNWVKDGTLLKFASPKEAAAAGRELAALSARFRKDPRVFLELARALHGVRNGASAAELSAFSAGFLTAFGPKNTKLVPRLVRAMEGDAVAGVDPSFIEKWKGRTLDESPRAILASFAALFANATRDGKLSTDGTITRTLASGRKPVEPWWQTAPGIWSILPPLQLAAAPPRRPSLAVPSAATAEAQFHRDDPGDAFQRSNYDQQVVRKQLKETTKVLQQAVAAGTMSMHVAQERLKVVERALSAYGTEYVWGGGHYSVGGVPSYGVKDDPEEPKSFYEHHKGFDCSGFVRYAYSGTDPSIARVDAGTYGEYAAATKFSSPRELQPGDLVFYNSMEGKQNDHVAIYLGNKMIINAPQTFVPGSHTVHDFVSIDHMDTPGKSRLPVYGFGRSRRF